MFLNEKVNKNGPTTARRRREERNSAQNDPEINVGRGG